MHRFVKWLGAGTLFLAAIFAALLVVGSPLAGTKPGGYVLPGPGPGGEDCTITTAQNYHLNNTIEPGEIGTKFVLSCTKAATINGLSSLLENIQGTWFLLAHSTGTKDRTNVTSLTMTAWYSCGSIGTDPSTDAEYRGAASWDVHFNDGYEWKSDQNNFTPAFFSACHSPVIAQFG